ncbi:unnamed protein product [Schistocephalus solidus]|uniref:Uncharacterized protein n=1 Tax=Schistocephalus solidus TaxID=70667 RepID=A0A183T5M9_SCHSO|nr:unnamed protein product [Schistocephalus solidus]
MVKPCQRTQSANVHSARIGLIGHLQTRWNNNPTTSNSATPTSIPTTTTTTPTTNDLSVDAPLPSITDTIHPPPPSAPITATKTTCTNPVASVATSGQLTPATSTTIIITTTTNMTRDLDSVTVVIVITHSPVTSAKSATVESIATQQRLQPSMHS